VRLLRTFGNVYQIFNVSLNVTEHSPQRSLSYPR
jgi:hypothetical protein